MPDPNGLCFSPDYKRLYVVSTGKGPGDTGPGGKGDVYVFDVGADNKVSNGKLFSDFMVDGVKCGPDGIRADVDGNLWGSSNAGRAVGYNGVTVWKPDGKLLGRIRLPEVCGNICFGGPKRNRLFMAASQSLYARLRRHAGRRRRAEPRPSIRRIRAAHRNAVGAQAGCARPRISRACRHVATGRAYLSQIAAARLTSAALEGARVLRSRRTLSSRPVRVCPPAAMAHSLT